MSNKPLTFGLFVAACLLAACGWIAPRNVTAQDNGAEDPSMSSLDQELFNDLGSDLFDDLNLPTEANEAPKETKPPTGDQPPEMQPGQPDPSADEAQGPRGFGADPSQDGTQGDPLSKIGDLMRKVQQRIAEGQAEQQTVAMQQEIIEEINKLLEEQQQQQQQNNSSQQQQQQNQNQDQQQQQNQQQNQDQQQQQSQQQSQSSQQQGQQQKQQNQQQQSGQESQSSDSQASEKQMQAGEGDQSTDQLREEKVLAISPEEQDALIKKAWGNLPPHLRKQISNTSMERFLPKYERLTQEYFRKLAEVED
ncbi:hypothetical protein [Blastopirellula marina]|nr:hypothetical protein [Blastopirellula marina]